ncbi:MAG: hypothetical protein ABJA98_02880 [Acidobacteriota bacterium]
MAIAVQINPDTDNPECPEPGLARWPAVDQFHVWLIFLPIQRQIEEEVRAMRARIVWAVVLSVIVLAPPVSASDSDTERVSLTGLTAVSVVVEDLSSVAQKSGLVGATLQADVERRLRQAGIQVTSDADAYLYVHVTVADPGASLPLPYMVEVALMQEVTLPRGLKTRTPLQTATWWVNSLGMSGPERLRAGVTDKVAEFADNFVRAFRSVNPAANR